MDEVIEFIKRRFPNDSNWLNGNCFFFTVILKSRFPLGIIFYDVILGHFVFRYKDKFYDWSGEIVPDGYLVKWDDFEDYDKFQYKRILSDCIG